MTPSASYAFSAIALIIAVLMTVLYLKKKQCNLKYCNEIDLDNHLTATNDTNEKKYQFTIDCLAHESFMTEVFKANPSLLDSIAKNDRVKSAIRC